MSNTNGHFEAAMEGFVERNARVVESLFDTMRDSGLSISQLYSKDWGVIEGINLSSQLGTALKMRAVDRVIAFRNKR